MRQVSIVFMWVVLAIPALQWLANLSDPVLLESQLPPGQWLYLLSKLVAQYAFLLLTIQLGLGLSLVSNGAQTSLDYIILHRNIGLSVLFAVLSHACLFIGGVWLRSGHFPLAVLAIQFDKGYYNAFVSVGVIAACLLICVAMFGVARKRIPRLFRYFHRLAWLVWGLGVWHSIAIGTETNSLVVWSWLYWLAAFVMIPLFIFRLFKMMQNRLTISS
ncbi:ferric reductase-like transmembrane domain-containing protein [Methylomonas koyamae]|uniref:Ferric oxidoreductase domain-containing protein n=1 Tax=Methylomonas koyamae TaxID=702114 RepID=A0AA91DCW2_9GAMM|nr:ferric reductase-like transmembrane domain-containing protein [Methylomonas koyamae]OAI26500.1 hypothetical protein A1356_11225 [Methylomonas koyamae]